MTRIVTVVGATGKQGTKIFVEALRPYLTSFWYPSGSSVLNALVKDGTFKIRAVTRNPNSEKAKAIKAIGAEVVECNLFIKADLEKAFAGAEAVFAVCL
jgi:hypothetical protein